VSVTVERASVASPQLVAALNALLPQLSTSAPALTLADVEAVVASDSAALFVATNEGRVVGTLTLVVYGVPMGRRGMIEDVVVDEGARRMGVAEALTRAAIDEARLRRAITIDLTSRPSRDAANELYRKLGFVLRETNVYRFFLES
jgi:ribosomal protein S18 acetylase RimI-like enzyme